MSRYNHKPGAFCITNWKFKFFEYRIINLNRFCYRFLKVCEITDKSKAMLIFFYWFPIFIFCVSNANLAKKMKIQLYTFINI